MKTFAFLFSFYVLLLSVYPAFAGTGSRCEASSCHKKQNCPKRNCTPFFRCPYIQITTNSIEEPDFAVAPVFAEYFEAYKESASIIFLKAPWHPPKS